MLRRLHTFLVKLSTGCIVVLALAALVVVVTRARVVPVLTGSMTPAIPAHSLVIAMPVPTSAVEVGDVVVFQPPPGYLATGREPVMHRIARLERQNGTVIMRTWGDHNPAMDPWTIDLATAKLFKVQTSVPYLGWGLQLLHSSARSTGLMTWAGFAVFAFLAYYATKARRRPVQQEPEREPAPQATEPAEPEALESALESEPEPVTTPAGGGGTPARGPSGPGTPSAAARRPA